MTLQAYTPIRCPLFIGRSRQLEHLSALLTQSTEERIALISGEAGIGKSRLVTEAKSRCLALSPATRFLQGRCYDLDCMMPFAPIADLIRTHLNSISPDERTSFVKSIPMEIARLIPDVVVHTSDNKVAESDELNQQAIFKALIQLLITWASSHPLILIFEDIHWMDDTSLEFLIYCLRYLPSQAIFIILTYRHDEIQPSLERLIQHIERERRNIDIPLRRMTQAESEAFISAILNSSTPLPDELFTEIFALTEGNPFFTEEVLKSLLTNGEISFEEEHWHYKSPEQWTIPRTIYSIMQSRIEHLSDSAKTLLTLAGVIGRQFDFRLLQALTQFDEPELVQLLKEQIDAQLVIEESVDIFAFRHVLAREAIYAGLLVRERRQLHSRIMNAIEQFYPETKDHRVISDLAYHAYRAEQWAKAIHYSSIAGEQARKLFSPTIALTHFTNAILSANHLNLSPPSLLYQARGKMNEMMGHFSAAQADYTQAIELARHNSDHLAESLGLLDLGFLWTTNDYSKAGDYFQQSLEVARQLDDQLILATSLNRIGLWHTHAEKPVQALAMHKEALTLYQSLNDEQGMAETYDLLGVTAFMSGNIVEGSSYFDEGIALCRKMKIMPQLANCLLTSSIHGGALLIDTLITPIGRQDDGISRCEEAITIAQSLHSPATEAYALIMMAHILGVKSQFTQAMNIASRALRLSTNIGHLMWGMNSHIILGLLYMDLLDFTSAHEHLIQAWNDSEVMSSTYMRCLTASVLSRNYIAQDQLEDAQLIFEDIISPDIPTQTLAQRLIATAYVEFLLASDKAETARTIIEKLINTASNISEERLIPRLWYLRGKALSALGQHREAIELLELAYVASIESANLSLVWRICLDIGNIHLIKNRREDAQDAFELAHEHIKLIASSLSDEVLRDKFLKQVSSYLPASNLISPHKQIKRQFDGLTRREREVAALVAQGKSNRHIADELILSERTIEKHIENIFSKLNFSSRSQIAVWAVEKGIY